MLPLEKIICPSISFQTLFISSRFKFWFALLFLYLFVHKLQKQSFLLWAEVKYSPYKTLKSVVLTLLVFLGALIVVGLIISPFNTNITSGKLNTIIHLLKSNFSLLLFTCLTAGITEELLFRGFLLTRLELVFKNYKYAIVLSSVLFGLLHISYGTIVQVLGPIVLGLVLAIHYYKYRNIKILITCHFLWDFISLLIKTK